MIEWLFGPVQEYGQLKLIYLSEWPLWIQIGTIVLCAAVVGVTLWNYGRDKRWGRVAALLAMRLSIVAAVLFIWAQPAYLKELVKKSKNHLLVVIDNSRSMSLPHGSETRLEIARQFLKRNRGRLDRLARENILHYFSFSKSLRPLSKSDPGGDLTAKGPMTDIRAALDRVRRQFEGKDLGGILLLTDGLDTRSFKGPRTLSFEEFAYFKSFGVPIHTFGFTRRRELKDVAISKVRYNDFAFIHNKLTINVELQIVGYGKRTVRVALHEKGRLVGSRQLKVTPDKSGYKLRFRMVPRKIGTHVFSISVERLKNEIYYGNNRKRILIKVLRDKIRVLQIAGRPSWDVRFMRSFLKENPNIDLISFFIMVNPLSAYRLSTFDTSLIPFPAEELFVEQLGSFDLVIFQDFNYGPFNTRIHLHRIRKYVLDGGALLMIGGSKAFSAGGYHGTEITDVLPVEIAPRYHSVGVTNNKDFTPKLTADGKTHPITRLQYDADKNKKLWSSVPQLEGLNTSIRMKPNAISLLEHPSLRYRKHRMPVVALREVKKGRSMVFMTDSSWFWKFPFAAQKGGSGTLYDKFWSNAVKWLIKDESLKLIRLTLSSNSVHTKDEVMLGIKIFNVNYSPATEQPFEVEILRWNDETGSQHSNVKQAKGKTGVRGNATIKFKPLKQGVYEIRVKSTIQKHQAKTQTLLLVTDHDEEFERVVTDAKFLRAIASSTRADFRSLTGSIGPLWFKQPRIEQVYSRQIYELWSLPAIFILLMLLFSGEWFLRRKMGYL